MILKRLSFGVAAFATLGVSAPLSRNTRELGERQSDDANRVTASIRPLLKSGGYLTGAVVIPIHDAATAAANGQQVVTGLENLAQTMFDNAGAYRNWAVLVGDDAKDVYVFYEAYVQTLIASGGLLPAVVQKQPFLKQAGFQGAIRNALVKDLSSFNTFATALGRLVPAYRVNVEANRTQTDLAFARTIATYAS